MFCGFLGFVEFHFVFLCVISHSNVIVLVEMWMLLFSNFAGKINDITKVSEVRNTWATRNNVDPNQKGSGLIRRDLFR